MLHWKELVANHRHNFYIQLVLHVTETTTDARNPVRRRWQDPSMRQEHEACRRYTDRWEQLQSRVAAEGGDGSERRRDESEDRKHQHDEHSSVSLTAAPLHICTNEVLKEHLQFKMETFLFQSLSKHCWIDGILIQKGWKYYKQKWLNQNIFAWFCETWQHSEAQDVTFAALRIPNKRIL